MPEKPIGAGSPQIITGNAIRESRDFNQWFVGDLSSWKIGRATNQEDSDFGLRDTGSVEVKWGMHPKGERRTTGWAPASGKVTLSILLRGRFSLRFRSPGDRDLQWEHILAEEGDYAIWDEEIEHMWSAEEDSIVLTVRWQENP